jgi:hypothetical protein
MSGWEKESISVEVEVCISYNLPGTVVQLRLTVGTKLYPNFYKPNDLSKSLLGRSS